MIILSYLLQVGVSSASRKDREDLQKLWGPRQAAGGLANPKWCFHMLRSRSKRKELALQMALPRRIRAPWLWTLLSARRTQSRWRSLTQIGRMCLAGILPISPGGNQTRVKGGVAKIQNQTPPEGLEAIMQGKGGSTREKGNTDGSTPKHRIGNPSKEKLRV